MNWTLGGVALLTALAAAPAHAQLLRAETVLGAAPPAPALPPDAAQVSVSREIFQSQRGLGVSARAQPEQDGSTSSQRGLVGSWEVRRGLEAGVGLFSITGNGRKHNEFKRDWTAKQVTPKNENIAAVGVRVKF